MLISVFNRREVLITSDLNSFKEARDALNNAGINYIIRTRNLLSPSNIPDKRSRGFPGMNYDHAYEYKIFVHKNDYEQASYVIRFTEDEKQEIKRDSFANLNRKLP